MAAGNDPSAPHAAAAAAAAVATPWRTALRLLLPAGAMLLVVLLLAAAVLGGARWLLGTEGGTRWLLGALPGVQVQGPRGALLGGQFGADRIELRIGDTVIAVEALQVEGATWTPAPAPGILINLHVDRLGARRVTVRSGPAAPQPTQPPRLAGPAMVQIDRADVAELRVDNLPALTALGAQGLRFDGRPGQTHGVTAFSVRASGYQAEGSAQIGHAAPLPVQATLRLAPTLFAGDEAPWTAELQARGPLAELALRASLRGAQRAADGGAAPPARIDAEATLRPLEAWPLASLQARTAALDLSTLWPGAPQTRLAGEIQARQADAKAPLQLQARLDNALPGRWNERRLPIARAQIELLGALDQRSRVEARAIELQLADGRAGAGRVSGRAVWNGHQLELDARLAGLAPQRLDSRAATMVLDGPVQLTLVGLPSPDPAATAEPPPWRASTRLDLEGRLDGTPAPVRLLLDAEGTAERLQVRRLRAAAGGASAELTATLTRVGRQAGLGDWQLASAGSLTEFDPVPWWPGAADSAWRRGPHRLNAGWQLDVRLPARTTQLARQSPIALAQALAGNGKLRVHESVLAGVPVAADIALGYTQAAAPVSASLRGELVLGGNRVLVEGAGNPAGNGDADRWRAEVQAPALVNLAPLARLHPSLAEWVPRQGQVNASIAADGRWPRLATRGQAQIQQLRAGRLGIGRGNARWQLNVGSPAVGGNDEAQTLELTAELSDMQLGEQRTEQLRATLKGTLADHRIEIDGALPVAPPAVAERLLGLVVQRGTRIQLLADGRWSTEPAGGGRWRARIERLHAGPWNGNAEMRTAANAAPHWAEMRDLRAELGFDGQGNLSTAQAEPGRIVLAGGALALRWDAVQADLRTPRAQWELRADVEPFALAPLLARAQPEMGWMGDLRLAARLAVKATADRFDADMSFERQDGDLHLSGTEGVQLFGLTEFRLGLTARDGVWDFSPVFNGRSLGEIRGTLRARTTPERRWPHDDAAIEGQVQARVADLGIWGSWVPAGWRLAGELRTVASVGGRFGAPTYTGELTGSRLGMRNLLQGVNVSEGDLRVVLEGETARIERFSAKGGEGRVQVTGTATLGREPTARLQLQAERFRVLGRVDRQLTASGRAELTLGAETSRLEGAVRIDDGLFDFSRADAPALDDDVSVRELRAEQQRAADPQAQRTRRAFALAVDVDLGEKLRAKGRGVDTGLTGNLRITNPGGRLAVNGTINTERGTYAAYAQKLEIERGLLAFGGPPENPRLDILAIRPNLDTRVGVLITGTAQTPRVRLFSEPEMGETDKLSWLLLGRAPDGLGRNDTAILQRAAVALLAGEGEAPTDTLMKTLGIDELSLRQSGDGEVRETVISLGKQLSRRWYLGYERGVNATTGTWQLIYRIAQRFTLRAQSGMENSLDVIWNWRLQEAPIEPGVRKSIPATPP